VKGIVALRQQMRYVCRHEQRLSCKLDMPDIAAMSAIEG
jgi:hypothetical protein